MLTRVLRRVRGNGEDAGISLTELLVTMGLMSIVGALSLGMLLSATDTTDRTTDASVTTAGARNTMSAWTGLLQVAVVPDAADPAVRNLTITPTSVSFNAQLDNLPACADSGVACTTGATTRVTLALATTTIGGDLQSRLVQTLDGPNGKDVVVQVPSGAGLVPAAGSQPACAFRPYRADGTALSCAGLSSADTASIARIDISFRITQRNGSLQTFTSTAKLPGSYV